MTAVVCAITFHLTSQESGGKCAGLEGPEPENIELEGASAVIARSKRKNFYRAVVLELECGHVYKYTTSFYRLHPDRCSLIAGALVRTGVWCNEGCGLCQPKKYLGTSRAD